MDSLSDNKSIIVITNMLDNNKLPIIATLRANGEGQYKLKTISSNYMTSVYAKDNLENLIVRAVNTNNILYTNKEKIQSLGQCAQLQLLRAFHSGFEFNRIVHQSRVSVNEIEKPSILAKIHQYQAEIKDEDKREHNSLTQKRDDITR